AVVFPPRDKRLNGQRDSKILSARQRERLARMVRERALALALGAASPREIDRYNIRVASAIAMRRAVQRLDFRLRRAGVTARLHVVIDGLPLAELGMPHEALVDGDALCASVAAAAIIAKTVRDDLMCRLARRYPGFGWETNAGYATEFHCRAIDALGPTRHHRRSFEPIAQLKLGV
ncbi:MAG: ribonuclease HII, partial [Gemmatimonadales bacterium]